MAWPRGRAFVWLLALLAGTAARAADDGINGELRALWDTRSTNDAGVLAAANALSPGIAPPARNGATAEAELRGTWHPAWSRPLVSSIAGNVLLRGERPEGGPADASSRVNELHASSDFGAWQLSAGKKIVGWDVGYGFRPNDFVQQEERRTLLAATPEGRPLLELEHFGAQSAASLVWVNPHHAHDSVDAQRGASESALAARWYVRDGAADWYAFARWGEHTAASLGAAVAWVATDELELHASARVLQRHDGWRFDTPAGNAPVPANPWSQATLGRALQGLVGASWTGASRQSVLVEWWHDGTALADRDWDQWQVRNQALAAFGAMPSLPSAAATAAAGNLAWQATPFSSANLRRDNVFVRLAWQPEPWQLTLDALLTPSDRGHVVTLGAAWQGDRLRLLAAWRAYGGAADSLVAQLPQRRVGLLAAIWSF